MRDVFPVVLPHCVDIVQLTSEVDLLLLDVASWLHDPLNNMYYIN